jgi:hypothetical protein
MARGLKEVAATIMMRFAGFPTPKIISYGDHPSSPHAPMTILMTRIPGKDLGNRELYAGMTDVQKESIFAELQCMIRVMRRWSRPQGEHKLCSVLGTPIRSVRISNHAVGPCEFEAEFNDHLFESLADYNLESQEKLVETVEIAEQLRNMRHPIVFTHGDLKHHNIMVLDGHSSAFLDWESAGWYPDYWEFTPPLRYGRKHYWWNKSVWKLGGEQYAAELESERALVPLTVDCWAW